LDKIVTYCQTVEKYLASFSDFVYACEVHTPESQKILDITNLVKSNSPESQKILDITNLVKSNSSKRQKMEANVFV
jgi:hypothetical protein